MIKALKLAKIVKRNSMRKKTLTGHAEFISQNGVAKCGGAAVKQAKRLLAASTKNTSPRTTPKTQMMLTARRRKKSIATCGASAAEKSGTR